jgi:uncharacterized membrane protein YvlD (DUF360 family)
MTGILRLAGRALVTWMGEALALYVMLRYLPGVVVVDWTAAAVAVLVVGLLNAFVRPAILLLAGSLGVVAFLLLALPLNAVLMLVAARLVPGFVVGGLWPAFLLVLGLAGLNALLTAMLNAGDDASFYRNVVRRLAGRLAPTEGLDEPGTVIVQIDGLAGPILRRALGEGRMPTLADWLASGSHRQVDWECDLPSMTTSVQAGILHGDNRDIPAFYWYEKRERRLMSSANPRDLNGVQRRLSDGRGLLSRGGTSVTNLFSGDAARSIMTVGTLLGEDDALRAEPRDFYGYLLNPYNLYRGLLGLFSEALVECWQALRQRVEDVRPRMRRIGLFTLQRGATNVVLRDATTWAVIASMYRASRIIYCDYLGYDEVAHYAGPETRDAVATLSDIDHQLRQLAQAAREAPRPYRFVVLSDHGQATARVFHTAYGKRLDAVVRELVDAERAVHLSGGQGEGSGYLSAFLNELVAGPGRPARGARRLMGMRGGEPSVELPAERRRRRNVAQAEVIVTSSGSLGHIYFANVPDRLSLEQLAAAYPGLIEALVGHAGLGFVMLRSESRGVVVLGKRGLRELRAGGVVEGEDPLAAFSAPTAGFLRRLASYSNAGDLIVNGTYDPATGQVVGIDDLVGAHGGVGGMQTRPFLVYPTAWAAQAPKLVGAAAVHRFLRRHAVDEAATVATTEASSRAVRPGEGPPA